MENWTEDELLEILKKNKDLRINKADIKYFDLTSEKKSSKAQKKTFAGGKREDLSNTYFRSTWEANIARYFNFIKVKWEYEPKQFEFPVKRGCVSYKPDFYLPESDEWIEVKGYMDGKSKTKLNRFKKYYPEEYKKLKIYGKEVYKNISAYKKFISNWEKG